MVGDLVKLQTALLVRAGLSLVRKGNLSVAESAFRRALRLAPSHVAASLQLASALIVQGRTKEGSEILRAIAEVRPDDVNVLYRLGLALARMSDYAGAVAAHDRVLALEPGHTAASERRAIAVERLGLLEVSFQRMTRLSNTLERSGRLTELTDLLRAIVKTKPEDVASHYRLGLALARLGDHAGAEAAYARVLELDPSHMGAVSQRAAALERMGRYTEAAEALSAITHARLDDVGAHYRLGLLLVRIGNFVGAESAFFRVLELDPGHAGAPSQRNIVLEHLAQLASTLESKNRFTEAADLLRIITQARPDDVNSVYKLGVVLTRLGDHDGAERAFTRVLSIAADREISTGRVT